MKKEPIGGDQVKDRKGQTVYPEPFVQVDAGRTKRKLGDVLIPLDNDGFSQRFG